MTFIYIMVAMQMLAWAWFSYKGGKLSDKQFFIFTAGMLIGQIGSGMETFISQAWGSFVVQVYFFCFGLFGGIKRYKQMKEKT